MYPYKNDSPRPPGPIHPHYLPTSTVDEYLKSCKGQYIRTNIAGTGTVVARLLGFDSTSGMVQLDIAYPWDSAGYTEVHHIDLTGISCIGWTLPPQYQQHHHHHGSGHGRQWIWTNQYGWIQVPY